MPFRIPAALVILFALAGMSTVHTAQAQTAMAVDSVAVDMAMYRIGTDSARVVLTIGLDAAKLPQPLRAFQFEWSSTSNLEYLGLVNTKGLAAEPGWTVAVNSEKGRVGGFSSSNNALDSAGEIIVLDLRILLDDQPAEMCFLGIRLNSDNPVAEPESICRVIYL